MRPCPIGGCDRGEPRLRRRGLVREAADLDDRLAALEPVGRSGSRLERVALERFIRTGVVYRRALHAAAHGERLVASVPPTAAQLDDWRALMVLYVEAAPRPRDETIRDPDAADSRRRALAAALRA